ncbi:MAG: hypothetical protein K0R66_1228 [Gammaproteobacteria bacterium]|jgi:hypothetical protein|nr:hypothetical protein [Gammaproteobacteria bacterium]
MANQQNQGASSGPAPITEETRKKISQIELMLAAINAGLGPIFDAQRAQHPNDTHSVVASIDQLEEYMKQLKAGQTVDPAILNALMAQCQTTANLASEMSKARRPSPSYNPNEPSLAHTMRLFFIEDENGKNHIIQEAYRGPRCMDSLISFSNPFGSVVIATNQVESEAAKALGLSCTHDSSWFSGNVQTILRKNDGTKLSTEDWKNFFELRKQMLNEKGINAEVNLPPSNEPSKAGLSAQKPDTDSTAGLTSTPQAPNSNVGLAAQAAPTAPAATLRPASPSGSVDSDATVASNPNGSL